MGQGRGSTAFSEHPEPEPEPGPWRVRPRRRSYHRIERSLTLRQPLTRVPRRSRVADPTLTLALTLALALTRYHAFQDERNLYMLLEYIIGGERLGFDPNPNLNSNPNPS